MFSNLGYIIQSSILITTKLPICQQTLYMDIGLHHWEQTQTHHLAFAQTETHTCNIPIPCSRPVKA